MNTDRAASHAPLCEKCTGAMIRILEERIRMTLEVGREERRFQEERGVQFEDDDDIGQSQCFHFMELIRIIKGQQTSGVYDLFGPPVTIDGPLFATDGGTEQ